MFFDFGGPSLQRRLPALSLPLRSTIHQTHPKSPVLSSPGKSPHPDPKMSVSLFTAAPRSTNFPRALSFCSHLFPCQPFPCHFPFAPPSQSDTGILPMTPPVRGLSLCPQSGTHIRPEPPPTSAPKGSVSNGAKIRRVIADFPISRPGNCVRHSCPAQRPCFPVGIRSRGGPPRAA